MSRPLGGFGRPAVLVAVLTLVASTPLTAQGIGGRLRNAVKEKLAEKVACVVTDTACVEKAKAEGREVKYTDPEGNEVAAPDPAQEQAAQAPAQKPGEGAWANYDFKPGDRVLYADDFRADEVGDFPRRMEFRTGAMEIVEWNGARWLRATETSRFFVVLPEVMPERFTLEFDYALPGGEVWISMGEDEYKRIQFTGRGEARVWNAETGVDANGEYGDDDRHKLRKARVLVDGRYAKVYLDDKRILNVPNADLERSNRILFYLDASVEDPALFGNFRVAAGGRKLYDALNAEGRVATQGIYFDTGSDVIRPESTPTLKEIAAMLQEHGDLRLTIEGHTDNVGSAASNQTLSEKRAAAVKAYLVSVGIDAARLETAGLGAERPVTGNDTPEGRQQNRRVELVKM